MFFDGSDVVRFGDSFGCFCMIPCKICGKLISVSRHPSGMCVECSKRHNGIWFGGSVKGKRSLGYRKSRFGFAKA